MAKNYNNMQTLHITTKKKWFDMEKEGIKLEEYRELTPYWIRRLLIDVEVRNPAASYDDIIRWLNEGNDYDVSYAFQHFDIVSNTNGYGNHRPNIKWKHLGTTIDIGKPEWGAEPGKNYFILKIGELL